MAKTMRSMMKKLVVMIVSCAMFAPTVARADACLDASDEARAHLAARRLLEARAKLRLCAAAECDDDIRPLCEERLGEVVARLPTVVFDVKDADGHDISSVTITVNGDTQATPGVELTLDPGPHVIVFQAEGAAPIERRFVLVEREKGRREHVTIGGPATPKVVHEERPPVRPPPRVGSMSLLRGVGLATMGLGGGALGVGAAFGVTALAKESDAGCDSTNVCDDPRSRHDARVAADTSTVSFVVAAALLGAGAILFWMGREPRAASRFALGQW